MVYPHELVKAVKEMQFEWVFLFYLKVKCAISEPQAAIKKKCKKQFTVSNRFSKQSSYLSVFRQGANPAQNSHHAVLHK